jgi:uncharacterized membrane protein
MQRTRLVIAVLLVVVGTLWVGQGLGIIPGSFMTNDRVWAVAGLVALSVGAFLTWDALRRS